MKSIPRPADSGPDQIDALPAWQTHSSAEAQSPSLHLEPAVDPSVPHRSLPCRIDRTRIIARAEFVLARARAVAEHLDLFYGLSPAKRPVEWIHVPPARFTESKP